MKIDLRQLAPVAEVVEVSNLLSELIVFIHFRCSLLSLPCLSYTCLVADEGKKDSSS